MAATVHVGGGKNVRYDNNTGGNVRIIIYYLRVVRCNKANPFYFAYGDSKQLMTTGKPMELAYHTGDSTREGGWDNEWGPTSAGGGYSGDPGDGNNFTNRATTNVGVEESGGSGTGMTVGGYVTSEDEMGIALKPNNEGYPYIMNSGGGTNAYSLGDEIKINGGDDNEFTPKFIVSKMGGTEAVREKLDFEGYESSSENMPNIQIEIGANLATFGLRALGQGSEGAGSAMALQNAGSINYQEIYSPDSEIGQTIGYTLPTEIFLSDGQGVEFYKVGIGSTHIESFNFVAIPEGG